MTLETIIVDDEPLARERLRELLEEVSEVHVQAECRNGIEAVRAIEALHPDLVFLDIRMPDLDGLGVVRQIGAERMPLVIFVSAFAEHAVEAFTANAVDYLQKPYDRQRFNQAIERALRELIRRQLDALNQNMLKILELTEARAPEVREPRYADRLVVRTTGSVDFVKVDDVDWVEAARNYVKLHAGPRTYTLRETMGHLEERLDPERFVRIHRSSIINVDRILRIKTGPSGDATVELADGTALPISRAYRRAKVRQLLA